jgi:polyribonucleotide nucleotidyltransferase
MDKTYTFEWEGEPLQIEVGKVANQANGAVLVKQGDNIVMVTATMSKTRREGIEFFPLTCDFEERLYSIGKIPGGFFKREGRPSERSIIMARGVDRPIRPLFPEGMRNDVQIVGVPFSAEATRPLDVLVSIGASAALHISDIPFLGPIGTVRIGRKDGEYILNPTYTEMGECEIDLYVAGATDRVMQLEGAFNEVPEQEIADAIQRAIEWTNKLVDLQQMIREEVGKPKAVPHLTKLDEEVVEAVRRSSGAAITESVRALEKAEREELIAQLKQEIVEDLLEEFPEQEVDLAEAFEKVMKEETRKMILYDRKRPDGRSVDQVRQISCEVGLLPRTHGSALFRRGQTQVLTACTLGSLDEVQIIDGITEHTEKRYMHNYNFPPFSVGETRPLRGPSRRDIGHGALAEKALVRLLPDTEEFPYALRLVSEVLESNGSTSMAATCSCSLALMDAGVKIPRHVSGIAMGLVSEGDDYVVLTDIQGIEDFGGDMDFKVTGTRRGVTAMQMDTKLGGLSLDIVRRTLEQSIPARSMILDAMEATISEPRPELSPYAPRIFILTIHPDKIGDVIGPGGRVIKKITAETGAKIDIEQDGKVYIAAVDPAAGEAAKKMIEDLTRDAEVGEIYLGRVSREMPFGVMVEILPGKEGLIRSSDVGSSDLRVGDDVLVKVIEIDSQGRANLSRKGLMDQQPKNPEHPPRSERRDRGNWDDRRPRSRDRRPRPDRDRRNDSDEGAMGAKFRPKRRSD